MQAVADGMARLIEHLEPEGNLDSKLERLLESELKRRLARYELVDKQLARKYGRSFDDFRDNGVVKQQGYSSGIPNVVCRSAGCMSTSGC